MQKMSVADAAEFFSISKEAIHNRVRRGSLESEIIDGEKYVFIDENKTKKTSTVPKKTRTKATSQRISQPKVDERYYDLLKEQNIQLQAKVEKLEDETRTLRNQKEQMLIDERKKIEQIYKDKDEQLKNILNAISSKFMLNTPEEHLEAEIEVAEIDETEEFEEILQNKEYKNIYADESSILTALNKYLKARDFSKKKRQKIKAKFEKNADKDKRIIKLNKKIYIDLGKYSYSDYSL